MEQTTFSKLELSNGDSVFLLTRYKNGGMDGFHLTISDGSKVWEGSLDEDDLDSFRQELKMDMKSIVGKTMEALTSQKSSTSFFNYKMNLKKDKTEFVWKKHVPDQDISFQLGSCTVKVPADPAAVMSKILNYCINRCSHLEEKIRAVETDNERLSQERTNALKRLEKCVVAKEEIERDLYSKFVDVLNSKKEKIRQLATQENGRSQTVQDQNESDSETIASTSHSATNSNTYTPKKKRQHSESDDHTTDEDEAPVQKNKRSKTKGKISLGGDDSLVLSTGDEESNKAKVVARPKRNPDGNKRKTPSKPVLPKVSSGDKRSLNTEFEKPTSMKKSGSSSSSNRSTDNIDADDLLNDL